MRRPRFAALETRMLRRLRVQQALLALIWVILGVVRFRVESSPAQAAITALIWILAIGFATFAVLIHLELRARTRQENQ